MHTLVFALFLAPLSLAAATCRMGALCNPLQADTLYEFLQGILQAVVLIGFPIIVLFIVWIGFRFVQASAAGNTEGLKNAKKNILFALIGALLLLGAQALTLAIEGTITSLQQGL